MKSKTFSDNEQDGPDWCHACSKWQDKCTCEADYNRANGIVEPCAFDCVCNECCPSAAEEVAP